MGYGIGGNDGAGLADSGRKCIGERCFGRPMKHQALKMVIAMLSIGAMISVTDRNLVPLLVFAAASYVIWCVAKGFDG